MMEPADDYPGGDAEFSCERGYFVQAAQLAQARCLAGRDEEFGSERVGLLLGSAR